MAWGEMPQSDEDSIRLAMILRDFFSAGCAAELAVSFSSLRTGKALSKAEARELEFEFNRLFVGPGIVPAPPFASVYLEKEPRLMGRSTLEVRELYLALGLTVPSGGAPDDFLPYELEAWVWLTTRENKVAAQEGHEAVREARRWLVNEHMALWLPAFLMKASAASPSPVMADILKTLESWLQAAKENV